jgi:hypothetical protein
MWIESPDWDNIQDRSGMNMPELEESEANARLIAAAPELISALESLTDSVAEGLESHEILDCTLKDIMEGLERSLKVIKKAKG